MITKILIANRGEIACRVIRTARKMGIATVAVFSDADADALHVEMADEAVRIGPSPAAGSYLRIDAILHAAKITGADAVHPGYGFLSENPGFVEAVVKAGLVFIGPSASAIRAMGLKDAAKHLMEKAKVPVVPGYHGEAQELVVLAGKANEIGFPVLIKARAGGGGKGMRRVDAQADFPAALSSAKREGKASFGDDRVLVEKYVSTPRHIEIQVFADNHGNVVHLFERDCSAQRRHQKVIEEAPAPGMTAEMRAAMGAAAVQAAKTINYSGAGTVEFIVDATDGLRPDRFWFMEMNTRLQVEHPVTELITGLDLVEWQIRVAAGEKLPLSQDQLTIHGHAVEARIYAEDPAKDFMPAVGTIGHLAFPDNGIRVDSGVRSGDTITPFYDPMIAKVIAHGQTRAEALDRLAGALGLTEIAGTITNTAFLARLLRQPDFASGKLDTGLIDRNLTELARAEPTPPDIAALMALAASGIAVRPDCSADPAMLIGAWESWGRPERSIRLIGGAGEFTVRIIRLGTADWQVAGEGPDAAGITLSAVTRADDGISWTAFSGGRRLGVRIVVLDGSVTAIAGGHAYLIGLPKATRAGDDTAGGDSVISPMPGIIKEVLAAPGQTVKSGDPLVIMEAMKMEMTLSAPRDGVVGEVMVKTGQQVPDGALLVALEAVAKAA